MLKAALTFFVAVLFLLDWPAAAREKKVAPVAGGVAGVASAASEALPAFALDRAKGADVHGVLFGHRFNCEEALINGYSLTLRQKHKLYAKVFINFAALRTILPNQEFSSAGRVQPRVEVAQRLKNSDKVVSQVYEGGKDFGLHIRFGPRQSKDKLHQHLYDDTTPGAIVLRFKNGDYIVGTFCARQSPRVIWDNEAVE